MAIDVYLQIDGIKGESQDDKHKDWIECASVNWGLIQPRSATASTGGGHTAERVEIQEITFGKMADLSSPILMQTCAMGKTIPKASSNSCARTATVLLSNTSKLNWKTYSSAQFPQESKQARY
jgi:type VI secretion system Hcp family effector